MMTPNTRRYRAARRFGVTTIGLLAMALAAPLFAKDTEKQPTLDDLLNLPTPDKAPAKPPVPGDDKAPRIPVPDEDKAAGGDAFSQAVGEMRQVADRLSSAGDTGLPTQRIQQRIIARLDQQIADLKNRQQKQKQKQQKQKQQDTGSKSNQQKPGQSQQKSQKASQSSESTDRAGQKGEVKNGELGDEPMTERLSEWGNLPPRVRKQLLQGWEDNFSQLYRDLTERYYRRLAEEGR